VVLAHGSGIDDILWFVVPVALVIVWLRVAERRARRRAEETDLRSEPPDLTGDGSSPLSSRPDE
jgi:hypothetical protein